MLRTGRIYSLLRHWNLKKSAELRELLGLEPVSEASLRWFEQVKRKIDADYVQEPFHVNVNPAPKN